MEEVRELVLATTPVIIAKPQVELDRGSREDSKFVSPFPSILVFSEMESQTLARKVTTNGGLQLIDQQRDFTGLLMIFFTNSFLLLSKQISS
jgi:hypothetical protein